MESESPQCPTCGHIARDWESSGRVENDLGHKVDSLQIADIKEDRTAAYRAFRRTIKQAGATDFDQIEWRFNEGGHPYPVGLLELSRVDGNVRLPQTYLDNVLTRIMKRDWQGRLAVRAAEILRVRAWMVLFRWDLTEFWVYNLTHTRGWWWLDKESYMSWLSGLKP